MSESLKRTLGFCCACVAFFIGAGYATMQEFMQYNVSYGSQFWIATAMAAIIYAYTNRSFVINGNKYQTLNGGDIYAVYCGKYIGKVFECFAALICYMSFIVMCGGANSTAIEQWGLPNGVGAIILTAMVVGTVVLGLESMLKYLKNLGYVIIAFILVIVIATIIISGSSFPEGLAAIDAHQYEIVQIGGGNPWSAGISYGGFVILWFATFMSEIGAKHDLKEVNRGMLLSTIVIFGIAIFCSIALISCIDVTWNVGVPSLVLANQIHPWLAIVFAFIIFLALYTSAIPLLWTGIRKLSDEGTAKYKWLTVIGGVVGCVVACCFNYKGLMNILYGLNGYMGFFMVAFILYHDIKSMILSKKK